MTRRRHPFLKLLLILRGAGRVHLGRRVCECRAGDAVLVPIDRPNRIEDEPGRPISLYAVCVDPKVWSADPTLHRRLSGGRVPQTPLLWDRLTALTRRLLFEQTEPRPTAPIRMAAGALEMLALVADAQESHDAGDRAEPSAVESVRAYAQRLSHNFYDTGSIDQVAESLGLSRRHFTELFRKVTGRTWLQRVRDLRLDHAEKLLIQTDRSIASIAFECGFGDLSSFYRAFKTRHKLSPKAWRKRHGA